MKTIVRKISKILLVLTPLVSGAAYAQDDSFAGIFKEMLPEVSYSATRTMTLQSESIQTTNVTEVVYVPHKEWTRMHMKEMAGQSIESMTDWDTGMMFTSVLGVVNQSEVSLPTSITENSSDASFYRVGNQILEGMMVEIYEFSFSQTHDGEKLHAQGKAYFDSNGIPVSMEWVIVPESGERMHADWLLTNIEVGPQDMSLFTKFEAGSNASFSDRMAKMMSSAATADAVTNASATSLNPTGQVRNVSGQVKKWNSGQGRIVNDAGEVIGNISRKGKFTINGASAPSGGIYPITSGYACDGATISNQAASYHVRDVPLVVVDNDSMPIGQILGVSSGRIARWHGDPVNNDAEKGYTLRMVYVNQPVQSTGTCINGSEQQERRLDFKTGWNIERMKIVAVGKSDYFPSKAPTRTVRETIDKAPRDVRWVFQNFTDERQEQVSSMASLPEPVEELVDEAEDAVMDEVKHKVRTKIRDLFD